ncbi:MAG: hypothetical protein COB84_05445 [Rhodobacteraceae bacterium]|nr:MAG: hypothetical protein COB84_05445 [Paracoccaceae bacterium]
MADKTDDQNSEAEETIELVDEALDDAVDEIEDDEAEEEIEEGASFSSRVLKGLALLVAGAAVALWGAPKLAPILPAGLAPVAAFLAPQSGVSELQVQLEDRIAQLETKVASNNPMAEIDPKLSTLAQADADLKAQLEKTTRDISALGSEISNLKSELVSMSAKQLVGAQDGSTSAASLKALDAKLVEINAAQSALGLAQETALGAKVDAGRQLGLSQANVALQNIGTALQNGLPFTDKLAAVENVAELQIPDALRGVAQTGVASAATLKSDLPALARSALREVAATATANSVVGKFTSFLKTQVGTRSLEPQTGDSADAVLSRIEAALEANKLSDVLFETAKLPKAAKTIFADWTGAVAKRASAVSAVAQLQSQLATILNGSEQ